MTDEISTIKGVFVFSATIIGAGILALAVESGTKYEKENRISSFIPDLVT